MRRAMAPPAWQPRSASPRLQAACGAVRSAAAGRAAVMALPIDAAMMQPMASHCTALRCSPSSAQASMAATGGTTGETSQTAVASSSAASLMLNAMTQN